MSRKVRLDLVGLDGSAFNLLGRFQRASLAQGWSPEINAVVGEATRADYDQLLRTLIEHTEPTDSGR